jgi:multiple sugar transport system permease protein
VLNRASPNRGDGRAFFYVMIAPTVLVLAVVILWPLLRAIFLSFTDYNLLAATSGRAPQGTLENYRRLLVEGLFWTPFFNTLIYTVGTTLLALLIGMILALLLDQPIVGRALLRSLVLIPWMVPTVVTSLLWLWILNPQYGVLNEVLLSLGIIHDRVIWLSNSQTAMPALIIATVWKAVPFYSLMLLAGLQVVSPELYDAAAIDGATAFKRFIYITIPSIRRIIMVLCVMGMIWGFQQFTIIWTTTKGGPVRATETLSITIYREAFEGFNIGFASAYGILGLIFLTGSALLLVRWLGGRD